MISLHNARVMRGEHILLDDTSVSIHKGQKVGIIGRNGSGKTSLFAVLSGELALDQGDLLMPAGLRVAQMRQETAASERSALEHVIDGDQHFRQLSDALTQAEADDNSERMMALHGELDSIGGYDIETRAQQLLSGLGFAVSEFKLPVSSFSGGWRIRLNLAAALMAPSDLLLLDEPTNHLDMETTLWLEQWLNRYEGTLLLISHDRSFLDKVIDHVISFESQQLVLYRGNYSAYELQQAERLAQQQAMAEKQQRRRAEIEDFVRRFRAKASKARQAQSRLKELNRMQDIASAHIDSPIDFDIPAAERRPDTLLTLEKLGIGYGDSVVVDNIRLQLRADTRIGLLGLNGSGKSTLLSTLAGELPPCHGEMLASRYLQTGYFAQHQVDVLDGDKSPLQLLQGSDDKASEQQLRNFLGGFDFRGDRVKEPIRHFSGGEKARLALALVTWQRPNLLLLDEPTNHLDMDMRHALTMALQRYEGALVIISHDRHLLENTVDEYRVIHGGKCRDFDGTLDDYARWLQQTLAAENGKGSSSAPVSTAAKASRPAASSRDQRQQAAARRRQLAPLRQAVKALEKQMEQLQKELERIEVALSCPDIYEAEQKEQLATLLQKQGTLRTQLGETEEAWLEQAEALSAATAN